MGFKLPDLSKLDDNKDPGNGSSQASKKINKKPAQINKKTKPSVKPKNTDTKQILSNDLNFEKAPDSKTDTSSENDDIDLDDLQDLTDEDFDKEIDEEEEEQEEPKKENTSPKDNQVPKKSITHSKQSNNDKNSFIAKAYNNDEDHLKTIKGVIDSVEKTKNEIFFIVKKGSSQSGIFYLRKKITGGNIDSLLSQATKNVPIEIKYNDKDTTETDDNVKVYTIVDLVNIDLSKKIVGTTLPPKQPEQTSDLPKHESYYDEPKESEVTKDYNKFQQILHQFITKNNVIGNKIYDILAYPANLLIKIPFIGGLLERTKNICKWICRLWILTIILIIMLILFLHTLPNKSIVYSLKSGDTKLELSNVSFSRNTNSVLVHAKNKSKTYVYYYLTGTVIQKGFLPFTKKTTSCTGPSVGQKIKGKSKIILKCSTPQLKKGSSYSFDIHNNV